VKIQVNAKNRMHSFESAESDLILLSGLCNAVDLPYECGTGTCGTCKAKLLEGKIDGKWPQAPGHKFLRENSDEFLMCQCVAKSDCTIEVNNVVPAMDTGVCKPTRFDGVIARSKMLTGDVIFLEIETDAPQDFDAGQFIVVAAPNISGFRGYSVVNFDRKTKKIDFLIKKKPGGGISEWLFNSKIDGTRLSMVGPLGKATFYPAIAKNILCIAGGSGVAGMMSIFSRACQENYFQKYRGNLFFGVRTMKDTFFLEELAKFKNAFPDSVHIVIALSDEDVPASAKKDWPALDFDKGFVHEVAGRHMQGKYQDIRAYLAGPPPAVDGALRMLIVQAKLTTDNICYDKFS